MNSKFKSLIYFVTGSLLGAASLAAIDSWLTNSERGLALTSENLSECIRVTDLTNHNDEAYRALKISDCMGSNGFIFIGTSSNNHCYAELPTHVQIKHIMPGCYSQTTIMSKILRK